MKNYNRNWGGKRKGAGRPPKPPIEYDEKFKNDVLSTISELEAEYKKPFLEQVFSMIYDDKVQDTVKLFLFKIYVQIFSVKKTEHKITDVTNAPKIYSPERKENSEI